MREWTLQNGDSIWTDGEEQDLVMLVVEQATWQTTATTMLSEAPWVLTTTRAVSTMSRAAFSETQLL